MILAPSEKHLENWILANAGTLELGNYEYFKFIGQQIKFPSGITDLIAYASGELVIFELKQGTIDDHCLSQLMRYIRDLKRIQKLTLGLFRSPFDNNICLFDPDIKGVLIGSNVKSEKILIAAECSDIEIYTYNYNPQEDSYTFEEITAPKIDVMEAYKYSQGTIGDMIRDSFVMNLEDAQSNEELFRMSLEIKRGATDVFLLEQQGIKPFWGKTDVKDEDANE